MSWANVAIIGVSAASGAASGMANSKKNKALNASKLGYEPYTGYEPPAVDTKEYESFRPVQQQYTDILKRRSLGEDVGYDPRVRQMYLENYDLENIPIQRQQMGDLTNQLGGAGLSRNLAAREAILGRQQDEYNRQRNLYRNKVDISDLERRNQERDVNTARLGALNAQNFQQENTRADFDANIFGMNQANRMNVANYNNALDAQKESSWGTGISTGLNTFATLKGGGKGGMVGGLLGGLMQGGSEKSTNTSGLNMASNTYNVPMLRQKRDPYAAYKLGGQF